MPPAGHLRPDSIMEKPCKINMLSVPKNTKPLAGRLTEIGKQILEKGTKEAKLICTGNWDEMFVTNKSKKGGRGEMTESRDTFFRPCYKKVTEYDATAHFDWRDSMVSPRKTRQSSKKPAS